MVQRLLKEYDNIIFFDTETDGLPDKGYDRIISLSAVKMTIREGKVRFYNFNSYISLNTISPLSKEVSELTGITQELLDREGKPEKEVCKAFCSFIEGNKVLLVAHNASFDLRFFSKMLSRQKMDPKNYLQQFDFLDTQSIYMDRSPRPHKLASAIEHYNLQGKAQNSHQSLEDAKALVFLLDAMMREKNDILSYVNLVGVSAKTPGYRNPKITYVRTTGLYGSTGKVLYEKAADQDNNVWDMSFYGGDSTEPYAQNAYISVKDANIVCLLDGFRNQKKLKNKPAQMRYQKMSCSDGKDRWMYVMARNENALEKICSFWEKNWVHCFIRNEDNTPYIRGYNNYSQRQQATTMDYSNVGSELFA